MSVIDALAVDEDLVGVTDSKRVTLIVLLVAGIAIVVVGIVAASWPLIVAGLIAAVWVTRGLLRGASGKPE